MSKEYLNCEFDMILIGEAEITSGVQVKSLFSNFQAVVYAVSDVLHLKPAKLG